MEIKNLQGAAAYANTLAGTPAGENSQVRNETEEPVQAVSDTENTASASGEAFEVSITQEAQNLQTDARADQEAVPLAPLPEPESDTSNPTPENQIVDIVA